MSPASTNFFVNDFAASGGTKSTNMSHIVYINENAILIGFFFLMSYFEAHFIVQNKRQKIECNQNFFLNLIDDDHMYVSQL